MIINGEKWACEACVRGHRVSNCQHSDRRLQHINRKGRPVSQCQHCRAMRKSRSAHVKCDCGNKNKCIHLQPTIDGHKETCCCNHGGKCTCASADALESVPESEKESPTITTSRTASVRRRRANTGGSEGAAAPQSLRHKTSAQKKRLSQKGSITRIGTTASSSDATSSRDGTARPRSSSNTSHHPFESELASPSLSVLSSPAFPQHHGGSSSGGSGLAPLDMSRISYPSYAPGGGFDLFTGSGFSADHHHHHHHHHDAPLSSAGLAPPSDSWSTSDFSAASSYRLAHGFGGLLDNERFPTLASAGSASGDVSEVDENFMAGDEDSYRGGYMAHQGHMFGHGSAGQFGNKYLSNGVGSFDDEFFALKYNDTTNMPDSPEDYSGFDYPYHYGV